MGRCVYESFAKVLACFPRMPRGTASVEIFVGRACAGDERALITSLESTYGGGRLSNKKLYIEFMYTEATVGNFHHSPKKTLKLACESDSVAVTHSNLTKLVLLIEIATTKTRQAFLIVHLRTNRARPAFCQIVSNHFGVSKLILPTRIEQFPASSARKRVATSDWRLPVAR